MKTTIIQLQILNSALFTIDLNGKVRIWYTKIPVNFDDPDHGIYFVYHGLLSSFFNETIKGDSVIVYPKNIGKSNETNINQQIKLETASSYRLKVIKGYKSLDSLGIDVFMDKHGNLTVDYNSGLSDNLEQVISFAMGDLKSGDNGLLKPMKAQKFQFDKFNYPAFIQPKINGLRCFIQWEIIEEGKGMFKTRRETATARSKEGHLYNIPHITDRFVKHMFKNGDDQYDLIYDGELYIEMKSVNYIKSSIPMMTIHGKFTNPSRDPKSVKFYCFDLAINKDQHYRINTLSSLFNYWELDNDNQPTVIVPTYLTHNDTETIRYMDKFISMGYEGAVIRDRDAYYNFGGRPKTMMKCKKFLDAEFLILDVVPKPKEPETGMFVLKNDINNEQFTCNPEGSFDERAEFLDNKASYIGKIAKVKFYERSGIKKVPFHANVTEIL